MEVRAGGVRTFLYLLRGELVFAEEESIGESLGRMLVRQRTLTHEQYMCVIDRMTRGLIENEQLRFGEVAVELGFMSATEVQRALAEQVRWKIIRTLQRADHEFHFAESTWQVEGLAEFPVMPLEPLIMEACRWVEDERKLTTLSLLAQDRPLVLREAHEPTAQRYQLSPDERAFLANVNGQRTVGELLDMEREIDTDVPALLTALSVSRGVAYGAKVLPKPAGPVSATRAPSAPPTAAAAMANSPASTSSRASEAGSASGTAPTSAATPEAHRTVVATPAQFLPFKGLPAEAKSERDVAKERADRAFAMMRQQRPVTAPAFVPGMVSPKPAPQKTSDVSSTPRSDHEARLLAEQEFQRGRTHLLQGQMKLAYAALEKARQLQPASVDYQLHAMWAGFAAGDVPPNEARSQLKALSSAAVKADPNSAFAFYVIGELALLDKNEVTAKRAFSHALKLEPKHADAMRRLRLLTKK